MPQLSALYKISNNNTLQSLLNFQFVYGHKTKKLENQFLKYFFEKTVTHTIPNNKQIEQL